MSFPNILFNSNRIALTPSQVRNEIIAFKYTDAVHQTICDSRKLQKDGKVFIECSAHILSNFGMTRSGPFKDINQKDILRNCWEAVGDGVLEIHNSVIESRLSRDRYLLEIDDSEREELIGKIWSLTKQLLPLTMVKTSYGLVGASKILFAVLPEIVLPVDNNMWLKVFQTVDLGDVIKNMVFDIQHWEEVTGQKLNEMDPQKRLTTLPSDYNVMAMNARPKK
jgi:hypothetical protein